MRRFVSSILAILVLVLCCFPCSDVDALPAALSTEAFIKAVPGQDCGGDHCIDLCSPFCTCSCCAGITLPVSMPITLQKITLLCEGVFAAYLPEATIEIALPIWQPPQTV